MRVFSTGNRRSSEIIRGRDPVKRLLAMAAALALGVSCDSKQAEKPGAGANSAARVGEDSIASDHARAKTALQARYAEVDRRLDSLWRDSLAMQGRNEKIYRRLLEEARTRRDKTQTSIALLDGPADTTDPSAWEILRSRAEESMDSLETSLFSVDSAAGSGSLRGKSR